MQRVNSPSRTISLLFYIQQARKEFRERKWIVLRAHKRLHNCPNICHLMPCESTIVVIIYYTFEKDRYKLFFSVHIHMLKHTRQWAQWDIKLIVSTPLRIVCWLSVLNYVFLYCLSIACHVALCVCVCFGGNFYW